MRRCAGASPWGAHRRDTALMPDLLALCADLPLRSLSQGEGLIDVDTVTDRMYVLASGSVTVERDGTPFATVDNPGAVFGEMSVVLDRPATATVRAASAVQVHVVDDPSAFLTERPGVALEVLRMTAAR